VLPTYEERESLESVVSAVLARVDGAHVLVVDDASPDGTGAVADALAAAHPGVEVLHRSAKEGLGPAYLAGFAHALERGAELVLEMDADGSHDPADLPRLIAAAGEADLGVGSRYVPGGGVRDWGLLRRALSRCGCWYARRVLGVGVRDLTGGFKCFRRAVLEELDLSGVQAAGYCFQIEVTYRALQAGFRVREVPIVFSERRAGRSKMTARIALEAVWRVPALRLRRRRARE
jgi:dolichol-phosphate mannosyltransferase